MVDISPAQTSTFTDFRSYIQAMQEVKISSDIPRSTARRMAEDQLRSLVEVSAARRTASAAFFEIKSVMLSAVLQFDIWFSHSLIFGPFFGCLLQNRSVRQFLLTNLVEQNGHYAWRVNLEAISAHLDHIMSFPSFTNTYEGPTLFLGGASSDYIR